MFSYGKRTPHHSHPKPMRLKSIRHWLVPPAQRQSQLR